MAKTQNQNYLDTILQDEKMTQEERIQKINHYYNDYREMLDRDLKNYLTKLWLGGVIELGGAAIPGAGKGKIDTKVDQKVLKNKSASKRLMDSSPTSNLSPERGFSSISRLATNDFIMTDVVKDFNPASTLIPIEILKNLQDETTSSFSLKKQQKNVDEKCNRIFTREEIGKMSGEEFLKNEDAITHQLKNKLIGPKIQDYTNYTNPISGDSRIFSQEDIGSMMLKEFTEKESAIMSQLKTIGIPTNEELKTSYSNDMGLVYVNAYTRDDGTEVKAHYRSKPGNGVKTVSGLPKKSLNIQRSVRINENNYYNNYDNKYKKAKFLDTLSVVNRNKNKNYPDAADLMDISIYGPENIQDNDNYKYISSEFNKKLSEKLKVSIPEDWDGVLCSVNSNLSKNIAKSPEFLKEVAKQRRTNFSNGAFLISLNEDKNLFRSIHNATVLDPHIDKNGYFNAIIFDLYDFKFFNEINIRDEKIYEYLQREKNYSEVGYANDAAATLQYFNILKKYYILIPIKIKLNY